VRGPSPSRSRELATSALALIRLAGERTCGTIASMFEPLPPTDEAEYDAWFRAKVAASLADERPGVPHAEAMAMVRQIIERARQAQKPG
jgi:hypothetical protein